MPWYLFSNFLSRHYRWTFFSHRSRVSQLDSLCSKGILGNPLIPWAKNASYSQFRDFLGYPVLPANNCIHCFVYKSKPRQNVLGRFWKLALKILITPWTLKSQVHESTKRTATVNVRNLSLHLINIWRKCDADLSIATPYMEKLIFLNIFSQKLQKICTNSGH